VRRLTTRSHRFQTQFDFNNYQMIRAFAIYYILDLTINHSNLNNKMNHSIKIALVRHSRFFLPPQNPSTFFLLFTSMLSFYSPLLLLVPPYPPLSCVSLYLSESCPVRSKFKRLCPSACCAGLLSFAYFRHFLFYVIDRSVIALHVFA
jgi:hypothetical protein